MDVNYFDAQHVATNTNHHQIVDLTNLENDDIPELLDNDTSKKTQENIEQYIRYKDELETIPEESDEDFQSRRKMTVMMVIPYHTSKGTWKMSSSKQPLMIPAMTR